MEAPGATAVSREPAHLRRRGQLRAIVALAVLIAWGSGLSLLVRREYFMGSRQRLAEAALRISPGAIFYIVEQGGKQVGFASTTIDTMPTSIDVVDYFIADLPVAGVTRRASARSVVSLSRGFALRTFDVQTESPATPRRVGGRADGDSSIVYAITSSGQRADTQSVAVSGPTLLPLLVPLAVALGETPKVGRKYPVAIFNPATTSAGTVTFVIRAESLFTVVDSASLDPLSGEWKRALTDTLRAWRVEPVDGAGAGDFSGWVDAAGRVVERTLPAGVTIRRMVYEIAFENWRIARDRATTAATDRDILERTAVSAGVVPDRGQLTSLTLRLGAVDLRGYDLAGAGQTLHGDTVRITEAHDEDLEPSWSLRKNYGAFARRFRQDLRGEPLLQAHDSRIVNLGLRIAGPEREPRAIAERIVRWVHDSVANQVTFSVPNALEVLRTRKGDCNEHTQLTVALARALGIPARAATGLVYLKGKFYFHTWPELYLRDWVGVDPTFGQFPADAAHIRFVSGDLGRQSELLRLIGNVSIQVVEAR